MIEVRECLLADHIDDIDALIAVNWEETGFDFPFMLDKERYKQFEAAGFLLVVAAFNEEEVVGYSLASVLPHPYNPAIICGNSDAMFLHPNYRNSTAGARLMFETERLAKERGANRMLWHARGDTDFIETLRKRGYSTADVVMMKGL